jgi:hypothetical protein
MDMKGMFDIVAMEGLADAGQPQRSLRQPWSYLIALHELSLGEATFFV